MDPDYYWWVLIRLSICWKGSLMVLVLKVILDCLQLAEARRRRYVNLWECKSSTWLTIYELFMHFYPIWNKTCLISYGLFHLLYCFRYFEEIIKMILAISAKYALSCWFLAKFDYCRSMCLCIRHMHLHVHLQSLLKKAVLMTC